MFKDPENLSLLQKLTQKLKSEQILFWIDGQDCYLFENTFHYTNKIKVGDLSQTKENYFKKLTQEIEKLANERQKRDQFLETKFSQISDLELIDELEKRTQNQAIKLSMYAGNTSVSVEGKDIKCSGGACLPIEIKEKDPNV